ncbi:MAG TPA: hypothetical protein VGH58_05305 [Solirubrobacterales bacterium]|jgi:hypothetical protein
MERSLGGARRAESAGHRKQGRPNVSSFVSHLPVSETERGEAGGEMGLVAKTIAGLLSRCAVIAKPIGLDHETQIRPVEVDPEAIHVLPGARQRQSRIGYKRQKAPLQLGVGHPERTAAEDLSHARDPWSAWVVVQRKCQCFRIDEIDPICLIDCPLKPGVAERSSEIDERQDRYHEGDAVADIDVLWAKMGAAVDADGRSVTWRSKRHRHLNQLRVCFGETPERR